VAFVKVERKIWDCDWAYWECEGCGVVIRKGEFINELKVGTMFGGSAIFCDECTDTFAKTLVGRK